MSDKPEKVAETTGADENNIKSQQQEASAPVVAQPVGGSTQQPEIDQSEEQTDRKQDASIASLAEQTEWIAKQTKWIRYQVIASSFLGAVTLGVLIYHGVIMRRQSQASIAQTAIMKGQLDSMNSESIQTQQILAAMQKQADAASAQAGTSQALAEQNQDLVDATLAQAEAAKQQAQIAQQSFYIGDRPYLSANAFLYNEFDIEKIPEIEVIIQNNGKTPALDFQVGAMVSVRDSPEPDPVIFGRMSKAQEAEIIEENIRQLPYGSFMAEGSKSFLAATEKAIMEIRGPKLTASLIEEIKNLRRFIIVWGVVPYKDGLGRGHVLKFCLFYNATDDMFVACPTFNSTS